MFRLLENVNTHQSKCELETKDNCEWEINPVLEYPEYEFECFHCGREMDKEGGYWKNEDRYCDSCACDLFDQPNPEYDFDTIDKWFKSIEPVEVEVEDDVESRRLTSECDLYEYDDTYDFDSLMLRVVCKICEQENVYTTELVCPDCWKTCIELPSPQRLLPRTRSYCDDPNPDFLENKQDLIMPRVEYSWEINMWDELAKIIFGQEQAQAVGEVVEAQAEAQAEAEAQAVVDNDILFTREDAAFISDEEDEHKNEVKCLHTCDCVYDENEIHICPKYYTACKICEYYISNNDMPIINEKHAVCSECLEINYVLCANCDDFSGKNMFCDKCEYKCSFAKQCLKCDYNDMPATFDYKMHENNTKKLLCCGRCYKSLQCLDCYSFTDYKLREEQCFECHFKKELSPQKPLEDHLQKIIAIQRLPSKQFGILLDYAALCEFTIFEAYQYKSQCHWPGCKIEIQQRLWDANEQIQFCCYKHYELFEDFEPHERFDDIDEEYDCVTCKACNSPHRRNSLQSH